MQTEIFTKLMELARENNIIVGFVPFRAHYGMLRHGNGQSRIAVKMDMSFDDYVYNLAHELAHYFLHYDKGDILPDSVSEEESRRYEEQTDRAAKMLLAALSVGGAA